MPTAQTVLLCALSIPVWLKIVQNKVLGNHKII